MQILEKLAKTHWSSRIFTLILSAWTALLLCCLVNLFVCSSPGWDQNWYLYAAHMVMSGTQLYGPQLVDIDPPFITWFSAIPAFLAHWLHLGPLLMLKVVVVAMMLGSLAWSARILRAALPAANPSFLYLALLSLLSAQILLRHFDVGQREHLLFILLVPYVLSAAFGDRAKLPFLERCAIGVIGGIAICFKPQEVITLVGLELFIAAWTRSLRRLVSPDFLCAVLTDVAYVALIRLTTPIYFTLIPTLRDVYWAFGPYSVLHLIKAKAHFNVILLLVLLGFILRRRQLRFANLSGAFLACCLAASIAFYVQHTGWTYQAYPFQAFLLLAALWIIIDLLSPLYETWRFDSAFAVSTLVFALLLLAPMLVHYRRHSEFDAANKPYPETVFAQYPPQTPVYQFSTSINAFSVVLDNHLVWASRFAHLWMLPAIVQNELAEAGGPTPKKVLPPDVVARLAAMQRADTTEDFHRWKPTVVIVQQCQKSQSCGGLENLNFDPLAWFLQSPAFAAEWANYRLQTRHGIYDVYTRIR
jgi:hypothetical protein